MIKEEDPGKLAENTVATLRRLSHDLSNAIENVMQASYLLSQGKYEEGQGEKWLSIISGAAVEAAQINREIREILRSSSDRRQ